MLLKKCIVFSRRLSFCKEMIKQMNFTYLVTYNDRHSYCHTSHLYSQVPNSELNIRALRYELLEYPRARVHRTIVFVVLVIDRRYLSFIWNFLWKEWNRKVYDTRSSHLENCRESVLPASAPAKAKIFDVSFLLINCFDCRWESKNRLIVFDK